MKKKKQNQLKVGLTIKLASIGGRYVVQNFKIIGHYFHLNAALYHLHPWILVKVIIARSRIVINFTTNNRIFPYHWTERMEKI